MRIVIAGAGEVGSHLAKLLSYENQDIVLVDRDAEKLANLDSNYNLMTMVGRPTSIQALREAGVEDCDLFIAVSPYEATNIISCSIAKQLGAVKTVARIDNYEFMNSGNQGYFRAMGVDSLIYPEYLAAQEILTALRRPWVRHWFELHDGEIILVGVKMRENAKILGMQLKDLPALQPSFHISAIKRRHNTIIPRGDDYIKLDDILYFTTTRDHVDDLLEICGKTNYDVNKVLIMGGSRIAVRTIALAGDEFHFKIIEKNIETCRMLSEQCPDCDIIHGDARDIEVLRDEGISDVDAFIALTDSSETNILACIMAKEFGVAKTIAEVENLQLISEAEGLNIGTTINKKLLASSTIFQLLLDSDSSTSKCHALTDAEVAEIEARPGSKITRGPVKDLNLSRDMTIAGLVRDGEGMLVTGNTVIQAGDHVVVFCLAGALHKIERLFN
ncbi:MAG: Trk system potassium transporter TrkA [Muribaculaceae bacterium]|nr:Trk system potassium transporter TrkA [Muribaculaceae bacterium]MBR3830795.1 Trk system potassium transporter TrkA [Muribaculaceae bacterium]